MSHDLDYLWCILSCMSPFAVELSGLLAWVIVDDLMPVRQF